jgi:hypothetical protein
VFYCGLDYQFFISVNSYWTLGFCKRRGLSWIAEQILVYMYNYCVFGLYPSSCCLFKTTFRRLNSVSLFRIEPKWVGFCLKAETEGSLRNIVFYIKTGRDLLCGVHILKLKSVRQISELNGSKNFPNFFLSLLPSPWALLRFRRICCQFFHIMSLCCIRYWSYHTDINFCYRHRNDNSLKFQHCGPQQKQYWKYVKSYSCRRLNF